MSLRKVLFYNAKFENNQGNYVTFVVEELRFTDISP